MPVRDDGRVDFGAADLWRQSNQLSTRPAGTPGASSMAADDGDSNVVAMPTAGGKAQNTMITARTVHETYRAKLTRLEYEKEQGLWIKRQDVENAVALCGRTLRQGLDGLVVLAEELDAAARSGGVDAVRVLLKQRVHEQQEALADSLDRFTEHGQYGQ